MSRKKFRKLGIKTNKKMEGWKEPEIWDSLRSFPESDTLRYHEKRRIKC